MARMVTKSKPGMNRKKRRFSTSIREQTQCRFCRKGEEYIDYKDIDTLQKLLTHRGKIFSRKRSGNCAYKLTQENNEILIKVSPVESQKNSTRRAKRRR